MLKDGRIWNLTGSDGMMQKKKMWVLVAYTVMFFVGLLLVPMGLLVSPSFYPGAIHNRDALGQLLYYLGFFLLTLAFNGIAGMRKSISVLTTICGIAMALISLAMPPNIFSIILLAGSGVTCGGGIFLVFHLFNPSRAKRPAEEKQESQSPARLSKRFKCLACVAIIFLATICFPGIHGFAKATTAIGPLYLRCRVDADSNEAPTVSQLKHVQNDTGVKAGDAVVKADGELPCMAFEETENASFNPVNSSGNPMITVGETTIEVVSNSSMRLYDSYGTVMTLEFNASYVVLNGTGIKLSSLQPQISQSNVGAPIGVANGGTFWWDGVQFVFGSDVKYYHPDRDHYNISPYTSWNKEGYSLLHYQLNQKTSEFALQYGLPAAATIIGAAIGTIIGGGPVGTVVGGIVGAVLGGVIWLQSYDMLDEKDCVWWWTSISFMNWLANNAATLAALYVINPALPVAMATSAFASVGYLMVGTFLFFDTLGVGRPAAPLQDIPTPGTPAFHLRFRGGSRTCLLR